MPLPGTPPREPQSAAAVLMVRPAAFAFNPETAASNAFQSAAAPESGRPLSEGGGEIQVLALREFDALADALMRAGVLVIVAADTSPPPKPDAVFPNNWVSFHGDGTVVLYPMMAPNRRPERREDIIHQSIVLGGYRVTRTVDLSHREAQGQFLEGTGSLVLDRIHRVAYASLSPRTDLDVLGEFAQLLDYDLVTFEACDAWARPVYHTNVVMAIGSGFAVFCGAAVGDAAHRAAVAAKLCATGRRLIDLSAEQMMNFAGNILELAVPSGAVIVVSTTAWKSYEPAQRRVLEAQGSVVTGDIPVIERVGGGGVRCMLAEIHLPKRAVPAVS